MYTIYCRQSLRGNLILGFSIVNSLKYIKLKMCYGFSNSVYCLFWS
jgi:hypothetical protein